MPINTYTIIHEPIPLRNFNHYESRYELRTNYLVKQWTIEQQESFISELLQQKHSQPITLRKIIPHNKAFPSIKHSFEILDGWKRIKAIRNFFNNEFQLPQSLKNDTIFGEYVPYLLGNEVASDCGYYYFLSIKPKIDETTLNANIIVGIENTNNYEHEKIASEILKKIHKDE
jgi:hypothetical protein